MDMYTNAPNAWLQQHQSQQSQQVHDPQHVHLDGRADDWKDHPSSASTTAGAGTPQVTQPTLDLSEFGLEMSGPSSSSSMSTQPQPFYSHGFPHFYVPAPPHSPYGAIPYGSTSWTTQPQAVPLSTYSTLNGATTTTAPSQSQPQQPSSQPAQMMIDPALTTINGSDSAQPQYMQPSNYSTQPSQRSQYPYQSHIQPSSLSLSSYVHPSQFYQLPHQASSQPQGTLSPHALHSPSIMGSLMSSLYSPSTASTSTSTSIPQVTISPQVRKEQFQASIKPLLQPNSFTGAGAVNSLVNHIDDFGSQDVDPQLRLEILTKIRDNAGNHYFRAWAENMTAMDITREWLKSAFTGKNDSTSVETIMPLLHIVDRLPLTLETLKTSKLGKIVVKLVKEPPAPAIKDMASNLERRWRSMLQPPDNASKTGDTTVSMAEDAKSKKRKPTDPPSKMPPATKKVAVMPTSKTTVVKKEVKAPTSVKDAKSDSSFFSAPKPKPKLPNFKKGAPPASKKELDPSVAQPSSFDPFQEALKSMKARKDSPAISTPPAIPETNATPITSISVTKVKKKTVSWAPEGQLESVRLIERAVYDDDPVDGMHTSHSLRDLDRGEGAALHVPLFEEVIDWSDPIPMEIPVEIDLPARGLQSTEKASQEEREQTALGALYMSAAHIPDSPGEPSTTIPDDEVDKEVKLMTVGDDNDTTLWDEASSSSMNVTAQQASVADLVGQLTAGEVDQTMASAPYDGQYQSLGIDSKLLSSLAATIPPDQLQQLMQQAQSLLGQSNVQPPYGGTENWSTSQYTDYGQDYADDGSRDRRWAAESRGRGRGRGRGGRGRGEDGGYRNNKRKPCSFFASGRCKFGDQCDFSHEPIH